MDKFCVVYIITKRLNFCRVSWGCDLIQFLRIMGHLHKSRDIVGSKSSVSCMNVVYKRLPIYKFWFLGLESWTLDFFSIKGFVIPLHGWRWFTNCICFNIKFCDDKNRFVWLFVCPWSQVNTYVIYCPPTHTPPPLPNTHTHKGEETYFVCVSIHPSRTV